MWLLLTCVLCVQCVLYTKQDDEHEEYDGESLDLLALHFTLVKVTFVTI
jgi:hypothetical protein